MLKLLSILARTSPKALVILFFVTLFAATGILTITELVENIQKTVSLEVRPYLGGDLSITANATFTGSLRDIVIPFEWEEPGLKIGEKTEMYTTLFDSGGKSVLVRIIAVDETYPMYSKYRTSVLPELSQTGTVSATPIVLSRFGRIIQLDNKKVTIAERIDETSEIGLGFGDEWYLVILPKSVLDGTELLQKWARLERKLLIQTTGDAQTDRLYKKLRDSERSRGLRRVDIESYRTNAERTNEAIGELGRYTLLIVIVCLSFWGISLYSGISWYFDRIRPSLGIMGLLGLNPAKQIVAISAIFVIGSILALSISAGIAYFILERVRSFPQAKDFVFLPWPAIKTAWVILMMLLALLVPEFVELAREPLLERLKPKPTGSPLSLWRSAFTAVLLFGILTITLWTATQAILSMLVVWGIATVMTGIIAIGYSLVFWQIKKSRLRNSNFWVFEGIRSLVRPGLPSASITLTLLVAFSLILVFITVSFAFRERLTISQKQMTNLYAINILPADRNDIVSKYGTKDLYAILRGRIVSINGQTPAEHLGNANPGGEITREFSITTNELSDVPIVAGKKWLAPDEVSVEQGFASQLKVGVGDRIQFSISGRNFTLRVANIRADTRETLQPFFFFQVNSEAFSNAPQTYFLWLDSSDIEVDKAEIAKLTGPHVVFIDARAILSQVQSVITRIFGVLTLFLIFVTTFAVLAASSLFGRARPIFELKSKLYPLLGMDGKSLETSMMVPLTTILVVSLVLSVVAGIAAIRYVLSLTDFLTWTNSSFEIGLLAVVLIWTGLATYVFATVVYPLSIRRRSQ